MSHASDPLAASTTAASVNEQPSSSVNPARQPGVSDPAGTGAGIGITKSSSPKPDNAMTGGTRGNSDGHGSTATGGQTSDLAAKTVGDASASGTAGQGVSGRYAPPWTSADWPAIAQKAIDEAQSRPDHDAYRELIRDYFEHR